MKQILKTVWTLWETIEEMAEDLTDSANRLKRQRDAGELPDARHDRAIVIHARALGRRITIGDMELFRRRRGEMSIEDRRSMIGDFVKAVGGYRAISERTGASEVAIRLSKSRGYLSRLYRHEYVSMAQEAGVEIAPELFETPNL